MSSDNGPAGEGDLGDFDMIVVGGGPAGSACAITAQREGLRVGLIERSYFPRHKVCGDCLNPAVWPLLEALEVAEEVRRAEHVRLEAVTFAASGQHGPTVAIPRQVEAIAMTRALFDAILMDRVRALGVPTFFGRPVTAVEPAEGGRWKLRLGAETWVRAAFVVGADGRNSMVARCLGVSAKTSADRVALQTHLPRAAAMPHVVEMRFLPQGYAGLAPVSASIANLCLVGVPGQLPVLQAWAGERFDLKSEPAWRSMTPLTRRDHPLVPKPGVLLAGDAARIVEPFTGEGIYYALATGMAAAKCVAEAAATGDPGRLLAAYSGAHRRLYAGRLWINRFARLAVTQPWLGASVIGWSRHFPGTLRLLTRKVVG